MTSSPPSPVAKPDSTAMPVPVSAQEFTALIWPPLSVPKRGPQCKIGDHKPFNYILKVLDTGRQWQELPVSCCSRGYSVKTARLFPGARSPRASCCNLPSR